MNDEDELPGAEPAPQTDTPPKMPEPRGSLHWERAILNAKFLAALARAQAEIQTVGKQGRNTEMGKDAQGNKGYDYAFSDDLVAELRRAFSKHGISLVSSWRTVSPPPFDLGPNQWLTCTVIVDWALLYGDDDGNFGVLPGTAECDAVGSAGRPPDKAMTAARTYCIGYVAMGLAALNRAKTPEHDDVDQRQGDRDTTKPSRHQERREPPRPRQPTAAEVAREEARRDAGAAWDQYEAVHQQTTGKPADHATVVDDFLATTGRTGERDVNWYSHFANWLRKAAVELDRTTNDKAQGHIPGVDLAPGEGPDANGKPRTRKETRA